MTDSQTKKFNDEIKNANASATRLKTETQRWYDIVNGPDNGYVTLADGSTKVKTASHMLKNLGSGTSVNKYALKTLVNCDDEAMGNIGFAGFSKNNNNHIVTTVAKLSDININSLYSFENKSDSPFGTGKGIIHTMVIDSSNLIQIVYKILYDINPLTSSSLYYIRIKSSSGFSNWVAPPLLDVITKNNINTLSKLNTKGDLLTRGESSSQVLPIGKDGQILTVQSGEINWKDISTFSSGNNPYDVGALMSYNIGLLYSGSKWKQYITKDGIYLDDITTFDSDSAKVKSFYSYSGISLFSRDAAISSSNTDYFFMFLLLEDNKAYSLGFNGYGQLGIGSTIATHNFTLVKSDIIDISVGAEHVLMLTTGGQLYAAGNQEYGKNILGNNSDLPANSPILIGNKNDWVKIFAGTRFSYAIDSKDNLYGWGITHSSIDSTNLKIPTHILSNVKNISYNSYHFNTNDYNEVTTLALKKDGRVYGWGKNSTSQLGLGHSDPVYTPTEITTLGNDNKMVLCSEIGSCFVVKTNNSVVACGNNVNGILSQYNTNNLSNFLTMDNSLRMGFSIKKIIAGYAYHEHETSTTLFILYSDGKLFRSGGNSISKLIPQKGLQGIFIKDISIFGNRVGDCQIYCQTDKNKLYIIDKGYTNFPNSIRYINNIN